MLPCREDNETLSHCGVRRHKCSSPADAFEGRHSADPAASARRSAFVQDRNGKGSENASGIFRRKNRYGNDADKPAGPGPRRSSRTPTGTGFRSWIRSGGTRASPERSLRPAVSSGSRAFRPQCVLFRGAGCRTAARRPGSAVRPLPLRPSAAARNPLLP